MFRRIEVPRQGQQEDGLNIISGDDDEFAGLFGLGQNCDVCGAEEGRIGLDPTCRGAYDGTPVLYGFSCVAEGLRAAYAGVEGVGVIVEPFDDYTDLYYYRIDEMPAYQFVREDIESVSWLMLTVGDDCGRCGEQSRFVWLTRDFVDPRLPEGAAVFRDLDKDAEHLCGDCAGSALAASCKSLELPLMTVELPRSAMGIIMPTGD